MKNKNKNKGQVARLYLKLMQGEITNKEFEEKTGCEPSENNPSRKAWELRNK